MASTITLVIPDAGPLISLATADRLDLLDQFAVPVVVLDVVKAECLFKAWPGRDNLERWFGSNDRQIEIISTPIFALYMQATRDEQSKNRGEAKRGLGDAAISWFVANASADSGPNATTLILTEDAALGDSRLGRDVHILSTRAFLKTLQNLRVIGSARSIIEDIERSGRVVAPVPCRSSGARGRQRARKEQLASDFAQERVTECESRPASSL